MWRSIFWTGARTMRCTETSPGLHCICLMIPKIQEEYVIWLLHHKYMSIGSTAFTLFMIIIAISFWIMLRHTDTWLDVSQTIFFPFLSFLNIFISGTLFPVLWRSWCHVCFHRWFQWVLWGERDQTWGSWLSPTAEWDHRRLRWGWCGTESIWVKVPFQIYCVYSNPVFAVGQCALLEIDVSYCRGSKCFICLVAGRVILPLCGEDKDHWELLHGCLWLSSRQTGWRSSILHVTTSIISIIVICLSLSLSGVYGWMESPERAGFVCISNARDPQGD